MMAAGKKELEEALGRWAREEMELPPLPEALLRRLCLGPCAPIWDFVIHHVRHPRNVKKIRGNLLWQRHLEETKGAGPAPSQGAGLKAEVLRLRREVERLEGALGEAQEELLELEEKLGAELARRGAWLRRGAELRLLGATAKGAGQKMAEVRAKLRPPVREWAGPALDAALRAGLEPEVLGAVRAVCKKRAESLEQLLLGPRPLRKTRCQAEAANEKWRREAEVLLRLHPLGAVLWALQRLAEEAPPPLTKEEPLSGAEATPTTQKLLQECWGEVGQLWGRLPPKCPPPPLPHLWSRLGGDPKTREVARLSLCVSGLEGTRGGLRRGVQELRGGGEEKGGGPPPLPPKNAAPPPPPPPPLEKLRQELERKRLQMLFSRRRLRELLGGGPGRLRPLQERVRGVAKAGLGSAPSLLSGEGQRLQQVLGELVRLGALGEPPPGPDPLLPVARALGLPRCQDARGELLPLAGALEAELREGAWLRERAWPRPEPLPAPPPPGRGGVDLIPRLQLVASRLRDCLQAWPRLQGYVSQWWDQPAQWALATPPGSLPFSYWMERWSRAVQALAPPTLPRPLYESTPTREEDREGGAWLPKAPPFPTF